MVDSDMDFFETVRRRRSIRRYTTEPVPDLVMEKALDAALIAPNSSNTQTWNFFWVKSEDKKKKLIEACLNQSAARLANQLLVVTADPQLWRRSQPGLIDWVKKSQAPSKVHLYYKKIVPYVYRWGFLNSLGYLKLFIITIIGFFRPIVRGPFTKRDMQEVAIKSAALACENFVLAISAQGYSSCMMEGFDEYRVARLLRLKWNERVVMVIAVGRETENGTWGSQFRIPKEEVIHII